MIDAKEKTALATSVGADERQSFQTSSANIIPTSDTEINHPDENSSANLEEIYRQMQRMNDPAYLHTVSMNDLYETVFQSRPPVIDGLLYSGTYLFAGAPKVGKSFFMAQLAYYNLRENPCKKAGGMGKKKNREMLFWTKPEYLKFAESMMDKPMSYYAFEMLYWCGIREGELLALTPADFDFEKGTVSINKTYNRLNGQDVITEPKTAKSNRVITMPQFLVDEIQDYLKMLYDVGENDRMFPVTKSYLHREMDRGAKETGVQRIRIHDIRHSHVSLLIDMGFSATAIADRVGHESINITYNYAHLFPSKQTEMATKLNLERGN